MSTFLLFAVVAFQSLALAYAVHFARQNSGGGS